MYIFVRAVFTAKMCIVLMFYTFYIFTSFKKCFYICLFVRAIFTAKIYLLDRANLTAKIMKLFVLYLIEILLYTFSSLFLLLFFLFMTIRGPQ